MSIDRCQPDEEQDGWEEEEYSRPENNKLRGSLGGPRSERQQGSSEEIKVKGRKGRQSQTKGLCVS